MKRLRNTFMDLAIRMIGFGLLIGIVTAYIALTQLAKRRYIARHGELL